MNIQPINLLVWGDFACFTRPEFKVERVSYPIITPSAARGVLEAIYWEPQFYYVIEEITVVRHTIDGVEYGKGNWLSIRRNEVQSIIKLNSAKGWMQGKPVSYIEAGGGAGDATQRNSLVLQHVAYLIRARIQLSALGDTPRSNIQKFHDQIRRRACVGKCFHRPYLGCREFAADFEWCEDPTTLQIATWPEENLGWMLYDVFDPKARKEGFLWMHKGVELPSNAKTQKWNKKIPYAGKVISPNPVFFHAQVKNARMNCNPDEIELLRKDQKEAS